MRYEGFDWSQQVEVNVWDLGGRGDGRTDNTAVLQQAIDQVAAQASAMCQGIVMVPAGTWLTGPIELKSYVTLRLDAETTLKALPEPSRFKAAYIGAPFAPGEALIYAHRATHCGIESWNKEGASATIDGSGGLRPRRRVPGLKTARSSALLKLFRAWSPPMVCHGLGSSSLVSALKLSSRGWRLLILQCGLWCCVIASGS